MKAFKTLGLVFKIGYSKAQDQDLKGSKKKRAKSKKGSIMSFTGSIVVLGRSKDAGKMSLERHKENPFTKGMLIPVKGKQVQLSPMGKDENILVNQATGETQGTHVTTYKKVDSEQFIKIFPAQIGAIFELKAAGIKTLGLLMWLLKSSSSINKDQILVDSYSLDDFLKSSEGKNLKLSPATMKRGLNELENASIIAKTIRKSFYFINPNFIFNGNRVAFTTVIDRIEEGTENQLGLDLK